jgi:acyl carrier protein
VSVRSTVLSEIETVAAEQGKKLAPLRDDLHLTESGLDSLCLALVVVKLEDRLGCDPFSESEGAIPVTLGEFLRLYEDAAH